MIKEINTAHLSFCMKTKLFLYQVTNILSLHKQNCVSQKLNVEIPLLFNNLFTRTVGPAYQCISGLLYLCRLYLQMKNTTAMIHVQLYIFYSSELNIWIIRISHNV